MGVEYLVCDECGETFCDCGEWYYCENCGKCFCRHCIEDAGLKWEDEEDECVVTSCKYCRNEAVSEDDMLYYLLNKLQITKENLEKEIIEKRKKEAK